MKIPGILEDIDSLVRIYDDTKHPVADHLTVVYVNPFFTDNDKNKTKYFSYLGLSSAPFHPQGFAQHGESRNEPIDRKNGRKNSRHLGKQIKFKDLNEDCRNVVLRDLI